MYKIDSANPYFSPTSLQIFLSQLYITELIPQGPKTKEPYHQTKEPNIALF